MKPFLLMQWAKVFHELISSNVHPPILGVPDFNLICYEMKVIFFNSVQKQKPHIQRKSKFH